MKKIIFLLVTFLMGFNVSALEKNEIYYQRLYPGVCDQSTEYPIYYMKYQRRPIYFLNYSENYNFNFDEYYPISFEDSPFSEDIKYFSASDIYSNHYDYPRAIQRLLWERLYPDKEFNLCSPFQTAMEEDEAYYNSVKDKIYSIYEGPTFTKQTAYQEINKTYEYEYEFLEYFKIISAEGLDAKIENNKLIVSGPQGRYQVVMKRNVKQEGFTEVLYTDGTNYMLWYPKVIDKEYVLNIIIGQNTWKFIVEDQNEKRIGDACFKNVDDIFCTDITGQMYITNFKDNLSLSLFNLQDKYEVFNQDFYISSDVQKIKLIEKKIEEEIEEEINEKPAEKDEVFVPLPGADDEITSEEVIIEVEDTLAFPNLLWTLLGGILIVKKHKKN